MDDSSVFGGGSRPLGVIWVEADLGSCDVELGEVDRVLGGFCIIVLDVGFQYEGADATRVVVLCCVIPNAGELEVTGWV